MADPHPHRSTLAAAFGHACAGIGDAWQSERNFRINAIAGAVAALAAALLRFSLLGDAVIALAIALVLSAELLNTGIEAVVDLVSPDPHPLARRAKDMGAGAVLIAAAGAAAAGLFVILGRVL